MQGSADENPPREGHGRAPENNVPMTEPRRPSASQLRQHSFHVSTPFILGLGPFESDAEVVRDHEDDSYLGQMHETQNVEATQRRCHSMSDLEHLEEAVWDIEDRSSSAPHPPRSLQEFQRDQPSECRLSVRQVSRC